MRANYTPEQLKQGSTVPVCAIQQSRSAEIPRVLAAAFRRRYRTRLGGDPFSSRIAYFR